MDLPFGLAAGLGEGERKCFAVRVVAEDFLAAIPAIDDVIDRTGIFEAQLARLEEDVINLKDCQKCELTLARFERIVLVIPFATIARRVRWRKNFVSICIRRTYNC